MGKKRIYELAKEMNKASKDVVDKAHQLGMDVKNHMGAISSEQETKLRQAFGGGSTVNTQSKATNNQKQQTTQNKPANKKPMNNKPGEQRNNQNRPNNQSTNGQQRNNNNQNRHGQSNTQNRSNQTNTNNQNRNTQNNNGSTTNQNRTSQNNNGGNNQNRGGQNRNNNFGGGQNRNNRNNFNNQNRNRFNKKGKKGKHQQESAKPAVPARKFRELPDVLEYTEGMNVADIAKKIHREPAEIIKKLFMMGVIVNQNQALDKDTIELLAVDYGMEPQEKVQVDIADIDKFFEPEAVVEENLTTRPPVVTIMGHVDHGKTTLLDTLRHSRVTSGEAGGITQHIGAYQLDIDGKPITFLDTPGHAAFTSMRARGASITDITILVVAADDGVMPQTIEAINHAKAAKVPIIVAVNKIDKPGANPDHVKQELSEHELIPEEWGGDTIFVNISAKFNQNIDELLENILLIAEVEDLKADPTQKAIGTVIEARLDKGKGPVATLLVQQGTLHVGDPIVVGNTYGRVRVMTNDMGRRDKEAGPATPVEITGLNDVPQAGDRFVVFEDEKTARQAGEERAKRALLEQRSASSRVTLDNLFESLKEGELKEVNIIVKADVQGSAEAVSASLQKIDVEGVRVKIVHAAVGAINESDVTLAAASNAIIIGFNVRPTPQAKQQAEQEEVDIRLHRIIYKALEEIETAMKGLLDPEFEEKITGQMTVRELYKVSKVGTIAGCYVTEGFIRRDSGVRVIRDGIVIYEGKLASLKRFKDDVKEVKLGFECGAMIENFNDLRVDDAIEGFIMEEIKQ
ncbi:translation initiation factor IF-2 [Enterococcus faecalis OG1RF]|jgi:bacterial translation initiation factor 2 (bIF-2)|uniref:translation initiation factor IF-2 n=2 Tax=Enterococcus faecalis TaxID=1351 RepID=UPI0002050B5B|nr:translation initiation factor IF-2 [Enterococcus faecalis]AEA93730.1 translation initiation factor IF2 [Enterococcus faecalis OG1RF]AZV33824.1 translation initiation factor IF-2 [Enterococcus faecalis OG1RF]AZV96668.1 translation initiation factor IF-2 [Enterococcus faecalis]ELA03873.1 translation initiation factor IF-2 [Enterococcus faecalis OG1X]ELA05353.1 translation initiation factor IF-2 [Enterococcus faecalis M7]